MIGKAQLLSALSTPTLKRIYSHLVLNAGGRVPGRERMIAQCIAVPSIRLADIVNELEFSELRKVAHDENLYDLGLVAEQLLRAALAGHYSARQRDGDPSLPLMLAVERLAAHLDSRNCWVRLRVGQPVATEDVDFVERRFGVLLPPVLRSAVTGIAGEFCFEWMLGCVEYAAPGQVDSTSLSEEDLYIMSGRLSWSVATMKAMSVADFSVNGTRLLPFFEDGEGNYIAFSAMGDRVEDELAARWWSHEDDPHHGAYLAPSAGDLLSEWEALYWLSPTSSMLRHCLANGGLSADLPLGERLRRLLNNEQPDQQPDRG